MNLLSRVTTIIVASLVIITTAEATASSEHNDGQPRHLRPFGDNNFFGRLFSAAVAAVPTASVVSTPAPIAAPVVVKTEYCSNPYGNPCGPGSSCTDTETGITCTPINLDGCPVGCGPNSSCQLQSQSHTYECICNSGFTRPQPFLPCISKKKN